MIPQPTINLSAADSEECERVRWYLIRITLIFSSTGPITLWSFAVIILYKSRLFDTASQHPPRYTDVVCPSTPPQSLTGDGCCGLKRVLCRVHPLLGVDKFIISPPFHKALVMCVAIYFKCVVVRNLQIQKALPVSETVFNLQTTSCRLSNFDFNGMVYLHTITL